MTVFLSILVALIGAGFLGQLVKDIRSDAFLDPAHPALVYKNKVKQQFGLSDPLVIVLYASQGQGIYTSEVLSLLQSLGEKAAELPNIDPYRVRSLATEKNIIGSEWGMEVKPFYGEHPEEEINTIVVRDAAEQFELLKGNLVAADGRAAVLLLEMLDELEAETSYRALMELVGATDLPAGVEIHVAGEGAITGYLGTYVDQDAQRLIPMALAIILLMVTLAFVRLVPALVTLMIIAASLSITIGTMAAFAIPFYVVTNALPVILIGISVADAIHIYSDYIERRQKNPELCPKLAVIESMNTMWRPVTLTSLTTAAGFLGLYMTAYMPPFKYFGLFAALGVMVAWIYSMTFLPAAMILARTDPRKSHQSATLGSRLLAPLGPFIARFAKGIILAAIIVWGVAGYLAMQLTVDEDPIKIFAPKEPVTLADKLINTHFNGSNSLDIVIETPHVEGLFDPAVLNKMEALQAHVETLPNVGGAVSIVDYLKQMNRALNGGGDEEYRLPQQTDLIAQYFLLYSATSDPGDLEEEVDYGYQTANIRVNIKSGSYQDVRVIVEDLLLYIDREFNNENVKATLSGRVNLHYRWISELAQSHFMGIAAAILLVLAISSLLFHSLTAGLFTLIPVAGSVLVVYAAMVLLDIPLGMGTSMFAAVAVGLGIDFGIHTIERMQALNHQFKGDIDSMFIAFYQTTGRALLFCFLAVACGFGILMVSKISSLNYFGAMVGLAVTGSFIISMTVLPALLSLLRPRFLEVFDVPSAAQGRSRFIYLMVLTTVIVMGSFFASRYALAQPLGADQVVANLNSVDDAAYVTRVLTMHQIDRRGKQRTRKTVNYRKYYETEKKMILFYLEPANVADTGFLIRDYFDAGQEDDQWLYLPAQRKVRRISAANRGDYFLGTDFTYEDMKLDGKLDAQDYDFELLGEELTEGVAIYHLGGTPKTAEIAKELGYSYMQAWIRGDNWMMIKAEFTGIRGKPLKTLIATDIRKVDGIWTRHDLHMRNHRTGHSTRFVFSEVDYVSPVKDDLFSKRALARGS